MTERPLISDTPQEIGDSFEKVVRQCETVVLRTAYRIVGNWAEAEDVSQEVFVRLHRQGLDFPTLPALQGWLYRVTTNLCLDRLRATRSAEELPALASNDQSAEAVAIVEEQKQQLAAALKHLPARERAALVLREIEGLTTAEVAKILGSSEGTVRSQVANALTKLKAMFRTEEG
jgi:RNA polymerase sigma-70 factor (ECF subfamily)